VTEEETRDAKLQIICDLRAAIEQIELEIAVNSNPGTMLNPKSEEYWQKKNRLWKWTLNALQTELDTLMKEMEGRENGQSDPTQHEGGEQNSSS
jgi:hypothetical protein